MLRGLTIFTGLLGVVLLGALVVIQVQRSLEDDAPTAGFETEDTLEDAEIDFGEAEPLGNDGAIDLDEPIDTPQSEPEPISTSSLDSTLPATSIGVEPNLPPELESPPRSFGTATSSFPIARDIAGAPPETPVRTLTPPNSSSDFPTPPTLDSPPISTATPPISTPTPTATVIPPAIETAPSPVISAPPSIIPLANPPAIQPVSDTAAVPPITEPAPTTTEPRVLDLPNRPALPDGPVGSLPEPPAAITPDAAQPASPAAAASNSLTGIGTVDQAAPQGIQQPRMEISKTIPSDGAIGSPLIYTIHIQNTGQTTAYEVILEDPIPQGAKLTGTVPQAELDAGRLSWELGTMKPGDQHKILVRVIPTRAGDLGSTATVRFASHAAAIARIAANNATPATPATATSTGPIAKAAATAADSTGQAKPATNPATKQAGITLQVSAPARGNVGDVLTLKFTLTNNTRLAQTGIVLRNEISAQLEHPAGSDLEYPLPSLAAGGSKEITLQVTAKTKGAATNTATLTSGQKLLAIDKDTIQIGTPQVLTIEQTVPPQASIGAATELKIVITNNSLAPTQPATLSQTLAPGLDFLASSGQSDYDPVNGQISWQLGSLPAGATATFTTTVRPRQIASKLTSLVRLTAGTRILATSSQSMKTVGSVAP